MTMTQRLNRPWGINTITDMYPSEVFHGLPNGRYVRAVAEHYHCNIFQRIRAAWWVFTGRAQAVVWPEPGDLEKCFPGTRRS
jgi:hypothetical protein